MRSVKERVSEKLRMPTVLRQFGQEWWVDWVRGIKRRIRRMEYMPKRRRRRMERRRPVQVVCWSIMV